MVVYAVRIKVEDPTNGKDFLEYMRKEHILDVQATKCLLDQPVTIVQETTPDGQSSFQFQIMYPFISVEAVVAYRKEHGPGLGKKYEESGWAQKAPVVERFILSEVK